MQKIKFQTAYIPEQISEDGEICNQLRKHTDMVVMSKERFEEIVLSFWVGGMNVMDGNMSSPDFEQYLKSLFEK